MNALRVLARDSAHSQAMFMQMSCMVPGVLPRVIAHQRQGDVVDADQPQLRLHLRAYIPSVSAHAGARGKTHGRQYCGLRCTDCKHVSDTRWPISNGSRCQIADCALLSLRLYAETALQSQTTACLLQECIPGHPVRQRDCHLPAVADVLHHRLWCTCVQRRRSGRADTSRVQIRSLPLNKPSARVQQHGPDAWGWGGGATGLASLASRP